MSTSLNSCNIQKHNDEHLKQSNFLKCNISMCTIVSRFACKIQMWGSNHSRPLNVYHHTSSSVASEASLVDIHKPVTIYWKNLQLNQTLRKGPSSNHISVEKVMSHKMSQTHNSPCICVHHRFRTIWYHHFPSKHDIIFDPSVGGRKSN